MEILMALFDFVSVLAFLFGAVILQRDLYNKMSKGAFAVFSTGSIIVFIAGLFKASHKFIYFAFNRDVYKLQAAFFPMMAAGFLLTGIGLLAMIVHKQEEKTVHAKACTLPIVLGGLIYALEGNIEQDSGTLFFVIFMVLGVLVMDVVLSIIAISINKPWIIVVIVLNLIFTLGMGYLSSKEGINDWVKEGVNTVAQCSFLACAILFRKAGLGEPNSLSKILKK